MTAHTTQKLTDPNDIENWLFKGASSSRWICKKVDNYFYYKNVTLHPNDSTIISYRGEWYPWNADFNTVKKWAYTQISKEPLPDHYLVIHKIAVMEERFKKRQEIKHARHNDVQW